MRYKEGVDSFATMMDSQRPLYLAERVLVDLNPQKLFNQGQLYAVLGGGG